MIDEKKLIEDLEQYAHLSAGDSVDTIKVIMKIVGDQTKVGEWIPCSERLPEVEDLHEISIEDSTCYLIQRRCGVMDVAHYIKVYGESYFEAHCIKFNDVNAWMPLPEPYREGQKTKKRTNADRIRNMTDEELAKEIAEGIECMQCPYNDDYETCGVIECEKLFLDWLQSEADQKGQEL